jgi:hypothetical protein
MALHVVVRDHLRSSSFLNHTTTAHFWLKNERAVRSQATTTRLTPADEAASAKAAYKNMEEQAWHEWPNEAGVGALNPLDCLVMTKRVVPDCKSLLLGLSLTV